MARRRRWPKASRSRRRYARRGRGGGRTPLGWILALALAGVVIWWLWPRAASLFAPKPREREIPTELAALDDSVNAATARGDWDAALFWSQHLVRHYPKLSGAHRKLATAWHNFGVGTRGEDRPPVRTSLDRMACELHALAAADSAMKLATDDDEWVAAALWYGQILEYVGLPLEAYVLYRNVLGRVPGNPVALSRYQFLRETLRDPAG